MTVNQSERDIAHKYLWGNNNTVYGAPGFQSALLLYPYE